jgi:uncharacterized protein (UPF0332 family)
MAFAQDLLDQAYHLANLESGDPKQSSLRRAVSTAYYALFHLLIDEAVGHWGVARHRSILARTFDHRKMKLISEDHIKSFYSSGQPPSGAQLKNVAQAFVQLQEKRHTADYDNAFVWSRENALVAIDTARAAFSDWQAIRTQDNAQDYLLQLFLPKMPKP